MIASNTNFDNANLEDSKWPVYLVEIAGYSKKFISLDESVSGQYPWLTGIEDYKISVNDLDGSADQGQLTFHVTDLLRSILADMAVFVFEGKAITVKTWLRGMSQSDAVTIFTGVVDSVNPSNDNLEWDFVCDNEPAELQNTIYEVGDSGLPTDSDNPKTVNGHPIDILVSVLTTQLGIDISRVDTDKLYDYRDGIFSGVQFTFSLTSPPVAKDFIESQLLKPLGGYRWVNSLGLITANFFWRSDSSSVGSIAESKIIGMPVAAQSDLINIVTFQFDQTNDTSSNSSGYLGSTTNKYSPSISKYGLFGAQEIDSDGMRSAFQAIFLAAMVSRLIFYRYGLKGDKFDPVSLMWNCVRFEPGDVVDLTSVNIPDRVNGVMGVVGQKFEVLDKNINFHDGVVELTLLDAAFLSKFGRFFIAPVGQRDFDSVLDTSIADARYMYYCDDTDEYSDGTPAHVLG